MCDKIKCIFVLLSLLTIVKCNPCEISASVNITSGIQHFNDSIVYDSVEYINGTWYTIEVENEVTRYGCPCIGRKCLWKCCGEGQAYFGRNCNNTDASEANPFNPKLYKGKEPVSTVAQQNFFYFYGMPCDESYVVDTLSGREEIYLQENGTLMEIADSQPQWQHSGTFCLDMQMVGSTREVAVVCFSNEEEIPDDSPLLNKAYAYALLLSVPFLLATVIVYAFVPELRNLHGMCLISYCCGLIVAYICLAYLKLHTDVVSGNGVQNCLAVAFIVYYSFQSSFFWLNIMCYDIWRTFRGYRGGSGDKRRELKRFAVYGTYAWGLPLALTACTLTMQFIDMPSNIITPNFGNSKCWFNNWQSEVVYFYTPLIILMACNVVLFVITAYKIYSIKQETAILKGSESARSDRLQKDKQRYVLYLKLFIVMGINWTLELISYAVGGSNWYWVITDIYNLMLGFVIFFIFVWKEKVRNLVRKRWRSLRGVQLADSTTGKWATRSSSAPTEEMRISCDETTAIRMKTLS